MSLSATSETSTTSFVVLFLCVCECASDLSERGRVYVHGDAPVIGVCVSLILCRVLSWHRWTVCRSYPLVPDVARRSKRQAILVLLDLRMGSGDVVGYGIWLGVSEKDGF